MGAGAAREREDLKIQKGQSGEALTLHLHNYWLKIPPDFQPSPGNFQYQPRSLRAIPGVWLA